MREKIKLELQRKIAEKLEQARGTKPPAVKQISEEERLSSQAQYGEMLYRAAR